MPIANVEMNTAKLADDFARGWVTRAFGIEALMHIDAALPLYTRGKRIGMPKGTLKWWKATTPGYAREVCQGVQPGVIRIELWTGEAGERDVCFGVIVCGHNSREGGGLDLPRLYAAGGRVALPRAA